MSPSRNGRVGRPVTSLKPPPRWPSVRACVCWRGRMSHVHVGNPTDGYLLKHSVACWECPETPSESSAEEALCV